MQDGFTYIDRISFADGTVTTLSNVSRWGMIVSGLTVSEDSSFTADSGTYDYDPEAYKAEGAMVYKDFVESGTWTILPQPMAAFRKNASDSMLGYHFTIDEAIAALRSGETVVLLSGTGTAGKTLADGEMVRLACEEGAVSDYYDYADLVKGAKGCTLTVAALEGGKLVEIASRIAAGDVQAQVGGKSYADVESAVEAVRESGGTGGAQVEVTSSEELEDEGIVVADVPVEITLDLGGVTTRNESGETPTLAVSGSVVRVTGEAEGGALVNANPEGVVIEARSGAKVTVESGFFDGLLVCAEDAELVVEGGTFTENPKAFVNPDESVVTRRTDPATGRETFTVSAKEVDLRVTPADVAVVALAVVDENGDAVAAPDAAKVAEANAAAKAAAIAEIVSNVTTEGSVETGVLDERLVMDALASGPELKEHIEKGLDDAMKAAKEREGVSDGMKAAIAAAQANLSREVRNRVDALVVGVGTEVTKSGEAYEASVTRETLELTPMAKVIVTAPKKTAGGEPVIGEDGKPVMEKETFMTPIRNEDLTGPITFRAGLSRAFRGKSVIVTHVGHDGYGTETIGPRNVQEDEDGNPYVELSFSHFSTAVFDMSEVREAAHTDTEATLGIAKVARPEVGGETAVGVPWVRSGVLTGEALPASELVTTGLRPGDTVRTWEASDATEAYAQLDMASDSRVAQGSAFWFGSGSAGAVPVTVSGLVSGQAETAVAAGSAERPAMTLLANPYRRDTLLAAAVAGAMAEGDQVVVEGGRIRLARKDGAWKVAERGAALGDSTDAKRLYGDTAWRAATEQELRVPAGKAFWYVSRGGSPTVRW